MPCDNNATPGAKYECVGGAFRALEDPHNIFIDFEFASHSLVKTDH